MEGEVSAPKAAVTATHHDLAVNIRKDLGDLGEPDQAATANLGIDDAGGRARACKGAGAKRRWRSDQAKRRRKRIEAMRKQVGGRVKKLFTTGVAPSIGYGAAVNGMTDAEVAKAQREAGRCLRPWGKGRSLTLTLLLHGDPTCMMANAPILQWSREVWYAGNHPGDDGRHLTLGRLHGMWVASRARPEPTWRSARGPMGVLRLTLARLGWGWSKPFEFTTDQGHVVKTIETSPKMVGILVREAWHRRLERIAAMKLDHQQFEGRRAFVEHLKPYLSGRFARRDPQGASCVLGVAMGSRWTRTRARAAGYDVDTRCDLCGEGYDDRYHRIYECTAATEARGDLLKPELLRRAREAGRDSPLYTRAIASHPGDIVRAKPADDLIVTCERFDGVDPSIVHGVKGPLYMDGSCDRHVCKELSRAAWCVVAIDVDCKLRYNLRGPVFAPFPQTPQAGEYMAAAVSCQVGEHGFLGKSDCWNVVRDMRKPLEEQLSHRRAYGAMLRDRLSNKGRLIGAERDKFEWVPAHVAPDSVTGQARIDAIANGLADEGAKAAVKHHPPMDEEELQEVESQLSDAMAVARIIARVWSLWPRVEKAKRLQAPKRAKKSPGRSESSRHQWVQMGSGWRCCKCLRTSQTTAGREQVGRCQFDSKFEALAKGAYASHCLVLMEFKQTRAVIICAKCGCWASEKPRKLTLPCAHRTAAGQQSLKRAEQGRHPSPFIKEHAVSCPFLGDPVKLGLLDRRKRR